jgi:hypothetical protein
MQLCTYACTVRVGLLITPCIVRGTFAGKVLAANAGDHYDPVRAGGLVVPRQESGDPFGLLLRQRIVFLGNQVDDFTADAVISQLLLLDSQDPEKVSSILHVF